MILFDMKIKGDTTKLLMNSSESILVVYLDNDKSMEITNYNLKFDNLNEITIEIYRIFTDELFKYIHIYINDKNGKIKHNALGKLTLIDFSIDNYKIDIISEDIHSNDINYQIKLCNRRNSINKILENK